jgi:hypothetical protein
MKDVTPYRVGDRVMVDDRDFPTFWANGATGTVAEPPAVILALADGWSGHVRMVGTTKGLRPYHWVVLDEPRRDSDGDGPYREAEIAASSLQPAGEHPSAEQPATSVTE